MWWCVYAYGCTTPATTTHHPLPSLSFLAFCRSPHTLPPPPPNTTNPPPPNPLNTQASSKSPTLASPATSATPARPSPRASRSSPGNTGAYYFFCVVVWVLGFFGGGGICTPACSPVPHNPKPLYIHTHKHTHNKTISPPELLMGSRTYGPAVDVWSAGCIMGEVRACWC